MQAPDVGENSRRARLESAYSSGEPDMVASLRQLLNFPENGAAASGSRTADSRHGTESLEALAGICTTAFDTMTSPLYAVCSDGRLLFANSAARRHLRRGQWLESSGGRITTSAHHCVAPLFDTALLRLRSGASSTLLLTDKRDGQHAVVSVAPVCVGQQRDGTPAANLGLVWLTTSESAQTPVKHMAELFNLTPAEENLLSHLAGGLGVRDAAERLKVSIHTVRNQLKSILNKTGRHSQAQLMSLVTRMGSLRLPDPAGSTGV
jgi:DNA-binding CsgD family transcriptional regulator